MTKRLLRTTLGVGTFSGLGKGTIRLLGQSPSPEQRGGPLKFFILLQYDPKTAMWLGLRTGRTSKNSPSTHSGE
jgi:hypothetical protein